MKKYKFKVGLLKISPQVAGERLEHLYEKHSKITADIIVDDARDEKAVLHPIFEWNDRKAAEEHRKQQARRLLTDITITVEKESKGETVTVDVRVFHNIRDDSDGLVGKAESSRYITIEDVMKDQKASDYLLKRAYAELVVFKNKYIMLTALKPHAEQLDKMILALKPE